MNEELLQSIKTLDKQNVYGSVLDLPKQCTDAWDVANKVQVPEDYKNTDVVVMCGMGGSGLGARVIESLYFSELKKPLIRINDYHIPSYTNEKTLFFVSSYSGNTEEALQNLDEALEKRAKILVIGADGKLIEKAKEKNLPYYQINPTQNPSNQPRMAIGYSVVGQLVLATKSGMVNLELSQLQKAVEVMNKIIEKNDINKNDNPQSLEFSNKMKGKINFFISSQHLVGATHVVNNQQNENAKNLTSDVVIPELNHHLMEGLKHPEKNGDNVMFTFFNSHLYPERIQKRFEITSDVVAKNNIPNTIYQVQSDDKFSQVFELIQFGAFFNFYLTMLNGIDPAPIPWVDYFKEKLEKI